MNKQNKKGRNKGKFRQRNASNKDIAEKFKTTDEEFGNGKGSAKAPNDVNWYVPDAQILNDVARIPYSFPVGYPFSRRGLLGGVNTPYYDDGVSGIACMSVMPTIGNAKTPGDAVNVAANGMYTFVRHLNSGSRNYDANDMMIYVLAVDSLYYMVSWMTRLYASMTIYSQANRYLPRNLVEAQYVDFDDLLANIAQFRAGLNMRIPRIATLLVPSVLPIFQRHSWLFQNYYIEGDSEKDQIYMFKPGGYYVFGLRGSDSSGKLFAHRLTTTPLKAQDLLDILDNMMDPIIDDEDFNIISGDIYKAYQGNVLRLGLLPDNMTLPLIYNEEVLLQFKNAKCCAVHTSNSNYPHWADDFFDVEQAGTNNDHLETITPQSSIMTWREMATAPNVIHPVSSSSSALEKQRLMATFNEWSKEILLTTPHHDVVPGENMVNTRLTLAFDLHLSSDPSNPFGFDINRMYFGSEWPTSFSLWTRHRNIQTGVVSMFEWRYDRTMIARQLAAGTIQIFRSQWPILSEYKYIPEIAILLDEDDAGSIEGAGRSVFELDNYTLVSAEVIGRLHDTAIMGEYNIPRVAMFPTR